MPSARPLKLGQSGVRTIKLGQNPVRTLPADLQKVSSRLGEFSRTLSGRAVGGGRGKGFTKRGGTVVGQGVGGMCARKHTRRGRMAHEDTCMDCWWWVLAVLVMVQAKCSWGDWVGGQVVT